MWSGADVIGLYSNNVVLFSPNVVLRRSLFSINLVPKTADVVGPGDLCSRAATTIFAGIAEFERDLIRERTGAGREAARKRGLRFGRPRKLSVDQEQLAQRLVLEGKSVSDIARTFNVHVATIYRLAQVQ